MKEHNIDQLFRQKLQEHHVAPTPAAWEQLSSSLQQRRRKKRGGYYAAAAAVALLLSASWLWLQLQEQVPANEPAVAVTEVQQPSVQPLPADEQLAPAAGAATVATATPVLTPEVPEASSAPALASTAAQQRAVRKQAKTRSITPAVQHLQQQETAPVVQQMVNELPETVLALELPEPAPMQVQLPQEEITVSTPAPVYASAEQVIIRYSTAAPAEEKDNTPEKALSLLQKVKQGEIGLASIRQAKDNLLSGKFSKP